MQRRKASASVAKLPPPKRSKFKDVVLEFVIDSDAGEDTAASKAGSFLSLDFFLWNHWFCQDPNLNMNMNRRLI